jgi:hypothetical protein
LGQWSCKRLLDQNSADRFAGQRSSPRRFPDWFCRTSSVAASGVSCQRHCGSRKLIVTQPSSEISGLALLVRTSAPTPLVVKALAAHAS